MTGGVPWHINDFEVQTQHVDALVPAQGHTGDGHFFQGRAIDLRSGAGDQFGHTAHMVGMVVGDQHSRKPKRRVLRQKVQNRFRRARIHHQGLVPVLQHPEVIVGQGRQGCQDLAGCWKVAGHGLGLVALIIESRTAHGRLAGPVRFKL